MNTSPFIVHVDDVGTFKFKPRSMRTEIAINVEYSRLTEGVDTPTAWLDIVASAMATLKVMTLDAPAGWDILNMDPLDEVSYERIVKVHAALRAKEESFRRPAAVSGETRSAGDGAVDGVSVSAPVQPAADRPEVP